MDVHVRTCLTIAGFIFLLHIANKCSKAEYSMLQYQLTPLPSISLQSLSFPLHFPGHLSSPSILYIILYIYMYIVYLHPVILLSFSPHVCLVTPLPFVAFPQLL